MSCLQESLHPLMELASTGVFKDSLVFVDDSIAEILRWSGAIQLLLREFHVRTIRSLTSLDEEDLFFDAFEFEYISGVKPQGHIVVLVSAYLWDMEHRFQQVISHANGAFPMVFCTTLSPLAHECHPILGSTEKMDFKTFEQSLQSISTPNEDDWEWNEDTNRIEIRHLPLHLSPLITSSVQGVPPTFVLSNPNCAAAFPLMLSHLRQPTTEYESVAELSPDQIPSKFRQSFKLLAHSLADCLMTMRYQPKDHVFALGSTALKVGHTLHKILETLQEECTTHELNEFETASVVLVDRTFDLASCSTHSSSLLDRLLAVLPQVPSTTEDTPAIGRQNLHQTEICPLHTADPAPVVLKPISEALAQVPWEGGMSLANPNDPTSASVFRSLVCRPAKLALRHLDKELRDILAVLVKQRGCPKPKKQATDRGRDVVMRWLRSIAEFDPQVCFENSELFQLGYAMLEGLERAEKYDWEFLSTLEQDLKQQQGERIMLELSTTISRHQDRFTTNDIFQLAIVAFTLGGRVGFDEYTSLNLFRSAVVQYLMNHSTSEEIAQMTIFSPMVQAQLLQARQDTGGKGTESDGDEWDWADESSPKDTEYTDAVLQSALEDELDRMMRIFKVSFCILLSLLSLNPL